MAWHEVAWHEWGGWGWGHWHSISHPLPRIPPSVQALTDQGLELLELRIGLPQQRPPLLRVALVRQRLGQPLLRVPRHAPELLLIRLEQLRHRAARDRVPAAACCCCCCKGGGPLTARLVSCYCEWVVGKGRGAIDEVDGQTAYGAAIFRPLLLLRLWRPMGTGAAMERKGWSAQSPKTRMAAPSWIPHAQDTRHKGTSQHAGNQTEHQQIDACSPNIAIRCCRSCNQSSNTNYSNNSRRPPIHHPAAMESFGQASIKAANHKPDTAKWRAGIATTTTTITTPRVAPGAMGRASPPPPLPAGGCGGGCMPW